MRSDPERTAGENRHDAGDLRRRALRALLIMGIASSPLIWVKLRLVTGIPRMAYATEVASGEVVAPALASGETPVESPAEAVVAQAD